MECHYQDNLPLEQLAQASGRSLSTFRRDFLKVFWYDTRKMVVDKATGKKLMYSLKERKSSRQISIGFRIWKFLTFLP